MFKRLFSALIAVSFLFVAVPQTSLQPTCVYAFSNYQVSANKNTTIKKEASQDSKTVRNVKKGEKLTVTGEVTNKYGNKWYKVSGGYVYSGNFTKVASNEKKVTTKNVNFNVLVLVDTKVRKEYYDGTGIVRNAYKNEVMSVTQEISNKYGNIWYKVRDGYIYSGKVEKTTKPVLEPQYTPPNTNLVPKEQERKDNQSSNTGKADLPKENPSTNQNTHSHNYKIVGYESAHPHYALMRCSCGNGFCSNTETTYDSNCSICTDPCRNGHDYICVGYEGDHPHYALYECTRCDSGYCSNETGFVSSCFKCNPQVCEDEEDGHICIYDIDGGRLKEHPHYKIEECECGNERINKKDTGYYSGCSTCNNVFADDDFNYSDFYGRMIDLSDGRLVPLTSAQQDAVRGFAADYHYSLDLFGMIPAVGNVFDAANALCYLVEGRHAEALLSGAALLPYVGILTTEGKIINKQGTLLLTYSGDSLEDISIKAAKKTVVEGVENLTGTAVNILKHQDDYADSVLYSIKKITEGRNLHISDVFYGNELLINKAYQGTVTSYAGLTYGAGSKELNRLVHVSQHAANSAAKGKTLFNVSGKELFSLIDDVYFNGDIVKIVENGIRTEYYIDAGYTIGKKGEHYMEIVLEDHKVITAYPIKGVD